MLRFAHPFALYFLLAIPVFVLYFVLMMRQRKKALKSLGEWTLLQRLMPEYSEIRSRTKFILLMLAWALLVAALSGPQIGSKLEKIKRRGIDVVFALDVSNSMLAQDITPNRLDRSKQAISRLLDKMDNDRVGIVIFAGKSYVQMPVTSDYAAAKLFLSGINPGMVPTQGTAIGQAIERSASCFAEGKQSKAIIVITDGENHEDDAVDAAKRAAAQGIKVFTVGMGSPDGAPIPVFNGALQIGYKTDQEGNTIISKLDDRLLNDIALAGNGMYVRASNSQSGVKEVFDKLNSLEKTEFDSRFFSDYEDRFQFLLVAALIILLAELFLVERKSRLSGKIKLFENNTVK
ncbi:MAG TPA: VWA domain-containing protein [Bacteroidales bacterium]|nr:VWA domain-containing protein [Bacteroidales bacterium]HPT03261.1 VWA domain-containing protein [Bacteroidales bacterium]